MMIEGSIYKRMAQAMSEIGPVAKNRVNPQQGFAFRGIDDAMLAVHDALIDNEIFFVPEVLEHEYVQMVTSNDRKVNVTRLRVMFTFFGPDGDHVSAITQGEAMDSADKATQKAMSSALKYCLLQTFCIPTAEARDDDIDEYSPAIGTGIPPVADQGSSSTPMTGPSVTGVAVPTGVGYGVPVKNAGDIPASLPGGASVQSSNQISDASPACPLCGSAMKHFNVKEGERKPEWKCVNSNYDKATQTQKGCAGVRWPKNSNSDAQDEWASY